MTAIAVSWWDGPTDATRRVGFVHSPTPDTVLGTTYGIVVSSGRFVKVPLTKLSFEDWR